MADDAPVELPPFLYQLYAQVHNKSEPITMAQERAAHKEALLAVARVVWDEGFDAGERDAMTHETFDEPCIPNPYGEEADRG